MIVPSDLDYKETKLVKQGKKILLPPIKEIVEWASAEFDAKILNAFCDVIHVNKNDRPRLDIIYERDSDSPKFRELFGKFYVGNFIKEKQIQTADKFRSILKSQNVNVPVLFSGEPPRGSSQSIDLEKLLVVFSVFEPIAKEEANQKIPKEKIADLQTQLNFDDLWLIRPSFTSATFFFYSDEQAETRRTNGSLERMRDAYFKLLVPYDEFNYFNPMTFSISLDSKENFDKKYNSSWFSYDR